MTTARTQAVVRLAREIAEIIPFPPADGWTDPGLRTAWEEVMLRAANWIATSVEYDRRVLDRAVGPALEVGVNPPWRVLLLLAQLAAESRDKAGALDDAGAARVLRPVFGARGGRAAAPARTQPGRRAIAW
jgi:hypothetical protein